MGTRKILHSTRLINLRGGLRAAPYAVQSQPTTLKSTTLILGYDTMTTETTSTTYRSRQEIFDIAYRGLAAQGFKQSVSAAAKGCAYRGDGNLKCAVGHLIADADYNPGLEGLLASGASICAAGRINPSDRYFAHHLQKAHDISIPDGADAAETIKHRLEEFAKDFDLTVPQVEAVPA